MTLENIKALTRETAVFIKMETGFGVFAYPAATDALRVLEVPAVKQAESFTDSAELVDSRSKPDRARDMTPAGTWDLKLYARPSGAAGTAPEEDVLMECALGKKTVNSGVSVVYETAINLPSFSLAFKEGHTCSFVAGCLVNPYSFNFNAKGYVGLGFNGLCQKVMRAGTSETTTGSTTTVINLVSGGAELFDVGAYVQVGSEDNSGGGYEITDVDLAADTITIGTAVSAPPAADVVVKGFLPTASWGGAKVQARTGTVTLDGNAIKIISAAATVTNNLAPDDAEINAGGFISDIAEGQRDASGRLECRFRREYMAFYTRARQQIQGAIVLQAGAVAGAKVKVELPTAEMNTPDNTGDATWRNIAVDLVGMPTSAMEDEVKVTYL